jgi:replication factor A1
MNVNVIGAIISKDGPKSFIRKNGSTGFVSNIMVNDGTGSSRVVLWDERAKETAKFGIGDNIEIRGGYVKENNGTEVHVGLKGIIKKKEALNS